MGNNTDRQNMDGKDDAKQEGEKYSSIPENIRNAFENCLFKTWENLVTSLTFSHPEIKIKDIIWLKEPMFNLSKTAFKQGFFYGKNYTHAMQQLPLMQISVHNGIERVERVISETPDLRGQPES